MNKNRIMQLTANKVFRSIEGSTTSEQNESLTSNMLIFNVLIFVCSIWVVVQNFRGPLQPPFCIICYNQMPYRYSTYSTTVHLSETLCRSMEHMSHMFSCADGIHCLFLYLLL